MASADWNNNVEPEVAEEVEHTTDCSSRGSNDSDTCSPSDVHFSHDLVPIVSGYPSAPGGPRDIRLLHIRPYKNDWDPLMCSLVIYNFDQDRKTPSASERALPSYEALSYTWGPSCSQVAVTVGERPMHVTSNLYSALTNLRLSDNQRVIWVDALCIDQQNFEERSAQVRLMGQIYSKAQQAIVWLGDSGESLRQQTFALHFDSVSEYERWKQQDYQQRCLIGALKGTHPSWWKRAWTMQEFVLAKKEPVLAFGKYIMTWPTLEPVLRVCRQRDASPSFKALADACKSRRELAKERITDQTRKQVIDILPYVASLRATNPRDKLYSLLELIHPEQAKRISINYGDTVSRAFTQGTLDIIGPEHNFELLQYHRFKGLSLTASPASIPESLQKELEATELSKKAADEAFGNDSTIENDYYDLPSWVLDFQEDFSACQPLILWPKVSVREVDCGNVRTQSASKSSLQTLSDTKVDIEHLHCFGSHLGTIYDIGTLNTRHQVNLEWPGSPIEELWPKDKLTMMVSYVVSQYVLRRVEARILVVEKYSTRRHSLTMRLLLLCTLASLYVPLWLAQRTIGDHLLIFRMEQLLAYTKSELQYWMHPDMSHAQERLSAADHSRLQIELRRKIPALNVFTPLEDDLISLHFGFRGGRTRMDISMSQSLQPSEIDGQLYSALLDAAGQHITDEWPDVHKVLSDTRYSNNVALCANLIKPLTKALEESASSQAITPSLPNIPEMMNGISAWRKYFERTCGGPVVGVSTERGAFGETSGAVREGDVMALVDGSPPVIVVLRPRGEHFTFRGFAKVYNLPAILPFADRREFVLC